MTRLRTIPAAICLLLVIGTAARAADESQLLGVWVHTKADGSTLQLHLDAGGRGSMGGQPMTWTVAGETLTIDNAGVQFAYRMALSGASLTLDGNDLPRPLMFQKQAGADPTPGGLGGNRPPPPAPPQPGPQQGGDAQRLVGRWKDVADQTVFECTADGRFLTQTMEGRYTVNGTTVTIVGPKGTIQGALRFVDDNTLEFTFDGETSRSVRINGGVVGPTPPAPSPAPSPGPFPPAPNPNPNPGPLPPSPNNASNPLVGRWRNPQRNTTFEFTADGQFNAGNVHMRYQVQGNSIVYTSQQGQTMTHSFQLVDANTLQITHDGTTDTFNREGGGGAGPTVPTIPTVPNGPVGPNGPPVSNGPRPQDTASILVGRWRDTKQGGIFEFTADGQSSLNDGPKIRYVVSGDTATLTPTNGQPPFTISLRVVDANTIDGQIQNGPAIHLVREGSGAPGPNPNPNPNPVNPAGQRSILGQWQDSTGGRYEYDGSGNCTMTPAQGQPMRLGYSVSGNTLTYNAPNGPAIFTLNWIDDNTVDCVGNGATTRITRIGGGGRSGPGPNPPVQRNGGEVEPARDIVGTWRDDQGTETTFTANGQMQQAGQTMGYSVNRNMLTLQTPAGQAQMQFVFIDRNTFVIGMADGTERTLKRVR